MKLLVLLLAFVAGTRALELDNNNWEEKTMGKTVFIKFMAPWCGHCKKLAPTWAKLMEMDTDVVVAKVDCTGTAKNRCDEHGVKGFPTLKYGSVDDLQDYNGGRDEAALKEFVSTLGPVCSLTNIDVCADEEKKEIERLRAMSVEALEEILETNAETREKAEAAFKKRVEQLQKKYEKAMKKKDKAHANAKDGFVKAVLREKEEAKDEL